MVKHIVMWRLKSPQNSQVDGLAIKQALESLRGKVPSLLSVEVGLHAGPDNFATGAADVVLYSEFVDMDGLAAYQSHPEHLAVIPVVRALCVERRVVDYEI